MKIHSDVNFNWQAFPGDPEHNNGIDIRTYIATHALAGLLAAPDTDGDLPKAAVWLADRLIIELNKEVER